MPGRDFFVTDDDYNVVMPVGNHAATVTSGTLVEIHEYPEGSGIIFAVTLEKPGSIGQYRSYVPLGAGVIVKRVDPEPDEHGDVQTHSHLVKMPAEAHTHGGHADGSPCYGADHAEDDLAPQVTP